MSHVFNAVVCSEGAKRSGPSINVEEGCMGMAENDHLKSNQ